MRIHYNASIDSLLRQGPSIAADLFCPKALEVLGYLSCTCKYEPIAAGNRKQWEPSVPARGDQENRKIRFMRMMVPKNKLRLSETRKKAIRTARWKRGELM